MIEAHVLDDYLNQRLLVFIVDHDRHRVLGSDGRWSEPYEPNVTIAVHPPSLVIPNDVAHQLLGALARQLGAVEHPEQLRQDFEHERRRVDDLVSFITGGSATRPGR